jgi:hypothetical protein
MSAFVVTPRGLAVSSGLQDVESRMYRSLDTRMASSAAMLYSSAESQLTGMERLLAKLDSLSI